MECVAAADTCCRTFYSVWVLWCAALAYTTFDPDINESFRVCAALGSAFHRQIYVRCVRRVAQQA
jgi:hypothetical protein